MAIFSALQANCQSKETDLLLSLESTSQKDHDSIYYELFKLSRTVNTNQAQYYARRCLQLSSNFKHPMLVVKACNAIGYLFNNQNLHDSARNYYQRAIHISVRNNFRERLVHLYNNMGAHYEGLDFYDSALHYFTQSFDLATQLEFYNEQALAKSNIGFVHYLLGNYDEALIDFQSALKIKTKNGITGNISGDLVNIARAFNGQSRYNEAILELEKVLRSCQSAGCNDYVVSDIYYQMGYAHLGNRNLTEASDFFNKALAPARQSGADQTLAYALYHLSGFEMKRGDYARSIEYLTESERIANQIAQRRLRRDIYNQFYSVYNKIGSTDKALVYQTMYTQLKDSLFNEVIANNLKNIELSAQRKESDLIIKQQTAQVKNSRLIIALISVICVLSFIIIFLIYRANRIHLRLNSKLENNVLKTSFQYQKKNEELTRSRLESNLIVLASTQHILGPLATLMGIVDVFNRSNDMEHRNECTQKILSTVFDVKSVAKHLAELYQLHKKDVVIEEINLFSLVDYLSLEFKHGNGLPIISLSTTDSVDQPLKTDRELLIQSILYSIRYFKNASDVQCIQVTFSQTDKYTQISIEDSSPCTAEGLQERANMFNFYLANMASWRIKGITHIVKKEPHSVNPEAQISLEINIPNDYTAMGNYREWEIVNKGLL